MCFKTIYILFKIIVIFKAEAPVESVAFAVVSWVCGPTGVSNMVAGHADK